MEIDEMLAVQVSENDLKDVAVNLDTEIAGMCFDCEVRQRV